MNGMNNVLKVYESNMVERSINLFLSRNLSDKSVKAYKTDICQFFNVDTINEITDKMIRNTDAQSARVYFNQLLENEASSSVSRKLSTLKSLYDYINNDRVKGNDGQLLLDGYNPFANIEVAVENNEYGSFTREEVSKLLQVATKEDALFYEILVKTSVRKEGIRPITVDNLVNIDGKWCIKGYDKGKKGIKKEFTKAINDDIYNRCMELADNEGVIFHFSERTALNRLKGARNYKNGYCYKIGISEEEYKERNLCIHSFRKTGAIIVAEVTNGNTRKIVEQTGHKNVNYAMDKYQKKVYNPYNDPSNLIKLHDVNNDKELEDRLNDMSKAEMRMLIMGLDKSMKDAILSQLVREETGVISM